MKKFSKYFVIALLSVVVVYFAFFTEFLIYI